MGKTTIVAPADDPLSLAVAAEARALGRSVASFLPASAGLQSPGKRPEPPRNSRPVDGTEAPAEQPLSWNPASYVSARAAVLEASVRYGCVDEAVIVAVPEAAPGLGARPAEIERLIHGRFLSVVWLVREILAAFSARDSGRGPGRLVMVLADRGQPPRDPLGAAAFAALSAFAVSLARTSTDTPYDIWVLEDSCPQDDLAAQYVSRILQAPADRKGGRSLRFTGKGGIFSRI
ncbi:MAG TPA: hypothetical protein VLH39_03515 [Magnetospirillaceae bacterium]|nr:hypothetical protein [Magnetospirillaceae bacterium]